MNRNEKSAYNIVHNKVSAVINKLELDQNDADSIIDSIWDELENKTSGWEHGIDSVVLDKIIQKNIKEFQHSDINETKKITKLIEDIVRKSLLEEINPVNKVVTQYKHSINYISLKKKIQQMYYDFAKFAKDYNLDHKQVADAFNKIVMDAKK